MLVISVSVLLALYFAQGCYPDSTCADSVLLNEHEIANGVANQDPNTLTSDSDKQNIATDTFQTSSCSNDDNCGNFEYCDYSRSACIPCRKRRKRCAKDFKCCPGNYCNNGICFPNKTAQQVETDGDLPVNFVREDNRTARTHKRSRQSLKGHEGDKCLRSTDCSDGLCCARHFWSRICKPVLTEGQVCTKYKKKGNHGLEMFQRCDCGDGLACRVQKGEIARRSSRNLHTCQMR